MSALSVNLNDYLALRRGLGHQLADAARLLPRFVAWMDATGRTTVTVAAAVDWAQQPEAEPGTTVWARRMEAVRGFARFLAGIDAATEVPPLGLLPLRKRWRPPFIYSAADITALLHAAASLPSPLRAATYETLFGLLAATGLFPGGRRPSWRLESSHSCRSEADGQDVIGCNTCGASGHAGVVRVRASSG